ncbi:UbiA prenyltransferase family-domain-containing protein [Aspergillus bertholletiae]|uniref:UbiA prenyltransferase family-domain-containing protein n=1 Tax=Aspergillus bertholletiae TaxID=1226010 RepID=A0A5N7B026_9EURO|nr:UbiA prenyltransferase family-domain-containing protein [Aspergillus bertholletiae]
MPEVQANGTAGHDSKTPKRHPDANRSKQRTGAGGQYGGDDTPSVLRLLPVSWMPYLQLVRLWPPAALLLIFFPHAFGVLHAAIRAQAPIQDVVRASILMFGGSFFFSNAAHIWNDLIDAPLDAQVERTRRRPIPRGAITPKAALVFCATQALGAATPLACMPLGLWTSFLYALPNIIGTAYYPFAKRHTHWPQLVLGFCIAWGVIMGEVAMRVQPLVWSTDTTGVTVDASIVCLVAGTGLWVLIYDTVYAHQDLEADLRVGIRSLAVLLQGHTKVVLWPVLTLMTGLLLQAGRLSGLGMPYYFVSVGGASVSLGLMLWRVNLQDSKSCWWWFSNGFWWTGGSIGMGLLAECYMQVRF